MPEFAAGPFDLAIIGAGIIGASAAALAAAYAPEATIAVVCAGSPGDGATSRSLAVDLPCGRNADQRLLAAESRRLTRVLASHSPALARQVHAAYWLASAESLANAQATLVDDQLELCGQAERDMLRAVFGELAAGYGASLYRSQDALVSDPRRVLADLLDWATGRPGCALVEGFDVIAVDPDPAGCALTARGGARIRARKVVAAPGAWALHGIFGATAAMHGARTKKVVAFAVRSLPPTNAPILNLEDQDAFLLPDFANGIWWLSITSHDWDCPPDPGSLHPDKRDQEQAEAVLATAIPAFRAQVLGARVGGDLYLPQNAGALVAHLDGIERMVLAAGGAGSGFRLGPAIAERALRLVGFAH